MRSEDLISSFGEIARSKDMDRDTLQIIVEDVFRAMLRKRYGSDEAFEIIFNPKQGDIQILHIQEVVGDWEVEDPVTEIKESEAKKIDDGFAVGDEVAGGLDVSEFGRRAVMTARQTFRQRIRDIEKEQVYQEYTELIGDIVVGEIYQVRRHETLLMHEDTELVLPRDEQIPGDHYRKGNMLRTVVKEVRRDAGSDPQVVVSRTSPVFMERLFEVEVPEVHDGIVEIKKVARIPGDRAKVAVESHDEKVDPVGACVGVKGVRINAVVRELSDENIDVMQWSDDPQELIARALSPAEPTNVSLNQDEDPPRARVEVPADEVSQAIGKRGVNIKLASQLTGYEIDVYREIPADEEDIDIEQFGDELTEETIGKLKRIGCDTGKAVLELSADALARRADLDRDTAKQVLEIIETEFEKGPGIIESIRQGRFTVESVQTAEAADTDGTTPSEASTESSASSAGATESADSKGPGDADEETPEAGAPAPDADGEETVVDGPAPNEPEQADGDSEATEEGGDEEVEEQDEIPQSPSEEQQEAESTPEEPEVRS
ncbi:transcription termination factor NusA [Salinibacter ruber]|uniref:Transcription termination/antitermination protein NusA n=1 Tax=Salinibacter ruber TaxID=146919 RepID=A0A9X2ZU24_9BACT|nr:transcription termination factor NusA [Salinibacter ruber]MCS3657644.1 N utilization substance protein A [Salinibacter ruber]MCS3698212.1 N utilization substance protein A [Salinibacter ruber]MCS3953212.1 N utilization substance protein A [Salinibacter ruber]MCS4119327.1 N utilization substance protein A [Salinibacter ruber]MCS4155732.1 N utilization substance protein A [Salinibacter ruber]